MDLNSQQSWKTGMEVWKYTYNTLQKRLYKLWSKNSTRGSSGRENSLQVTVEHPTNTSPRHHASAVSGCTSMTTATRSSRLNRRMMSWCRDDVTRPAQGSCCSWPAPQPPAIPLHTTAPEKHGASAAEPQPQCTVLYQMPTTSPDLKRFQGSHLAPLQSPPDKSSNIILQRHACKAWGSCLATCSLESIPRTFINTFLAT